MENITQIPQDWLTDFIRFFPRLIFSLTIFVAALAGAGLLGRLVQREMERRRVDPELALLSGQVTRWGCPEVCAGDPGEAISSAPGAASPLPMQSVSREPSGGATARPQGGMVCRRGTSPATAAPVPKPSP